MARTSQGRRRHRRRMTATAVLAEDGCFISGPSETEPGVISTRLGVRGGRLGVPGGEAADGTTTAAEERQRPKNEENDEDV